MSALIAIEILGKKRRSVRVAVQVEVTSIK